MLERLVRMLFFKLDINKGVAFTAASLTAAMRRIVRRGLTITTVIDVGASNGQWSEEITRFFPKASFLLIEAQKDHRADLERFVTGRAGAHYVLKAAGAHEGVIYFDADAPFAGQAVGSNDRAGLVELPVTTIDSEVRRLNLPGPYLIKLDVHGFELPILAGAAMTLDQTDLIVMECYNFEIGSQALLFHDMCRHMETLGFRVIDISEPLWRPRDEALWQFDLFFVRASRPEFATKTYA